MSKQYITLKIEVETLEKFKQAKRLREFKMNEDLTITEFIEIMLEKEFRKYDGKTIERIEE